MADVKIPKSVTLHLNTREQKIGNLHDILAKIGGIAGCPACGRIALLRVDLLGDPPVELGKIGVTSMQLEH